MKEVSFREKPRIGQMNRLLLVLDPYTESRADKRTRDADLFF